MSQHDLSLIHERSMSFTTFKIKSVIFIYTAAVFGALSRELLGSILNERLYISSSSRSSEVSSK